MCWRARVPLLLVLLSPVFAASAAAQSQEAAGTRASGMAGAFTAVADDASAVYWNPAGLASGSFFSLVADWNTAKATFDEDDRARSQSGLLVALGTPALGVSYYRLRETAIRIPQLAPSPVVLDRSAGTLQLDSLVTHHVGATLVQSIVPQVAVGATVKLVRGFAATALVPPGDPDDILDASGDLIGASTNKFDLDVGAMANFGTLKAGLSVRNVTEPEFEAAGGAGRLQLARRFRAGVALVAAEGWIVALDGDLNRTPGTYGDERNLAVGTEGRIARAMVRTGVRFNTIGGLPGGHSPVWSVGGSYAVLTSLFLDGQFTTGTDSGGHGWGISARVAY